MPSLYGVNLPAAAVLQSTIGASSQAVAACRAVESERKDALFVDPLAKHFAGYSGGDLPAFLSSYVSVRTHFIDLELLDALCKKHDQVPSGGVIPNQVQPDIPCLHAYQGVLHYVSPLKSNGTRGCRPCLSHEIPIVPISRCDLCLFEIVHHRHHCHNRWHATVQVVLLGAGMDARMWRLPPQAESKPLAEVVFELDQKEVRQALSFLVPLAPSSAVAICKKEGRGTR